MIVSLRLPQGRQWLLGLGLAAGAVVLLPLFSLLAGSIFSGRAFVLYLPFFYLMAAYTDPARYVAINLAVLLVVFSALIWARPRWIAMAWLAASIVVIVAYPLTLGSYQPALSAAPGLRAVVPTQPVLLMDSVARQAEAAVETRSCTYHLLGWGGDGAFYYQSACGDVRSLWAAAPVAGSRPVRIAAAPAGLAGQAVSKDEALAAVRVPGVRPAGDEPSVRALMLVGGEALRSPDGRWLAVVSQHIYGPQDVLLITSGE